MSAARLRVIYVDDDADIREVVGLALSLDPGIDTQLCADGAEALAVAAAFRPDLMVLDVMMPDMDGRAVLAALRADPATAAIPVAFCTASAQPREVARLRALGAIAVLDKPFDPMTLAAAIRALATG